MSGRVPPAPLMDWGKKNSFYHDQIERYLSFHASKGDSLLVLGCGSGRIFDVARSASCVGIDTRLELIDQAKAGFQNHRNVVFHHVDDYGNMPEMGRVFDIVILYDVIAELTDIQSLLEGLRRFMTARSRLILNFHSHLWHPILLLAEKLGLKRPTRNPTWVTIEDITNLAILSDYEVITRERCILLPKRFLGLGPFVNRWLAPLPALEFLCLENIIVARPMGLKSDSSQPSITILVPARNEAGNIENIIKRLPPMGKRMDLIFVEGNSTDDTWNEIHRVRDAYPQLDIQVLKQPGRGKGDAVRFGLARATGDILAILDADLTMPPEDLPKYFNAIAANKGEFINGCRLVYPTEKEAMRFLNMIANKFFGWLFTWLLGQRYRDTLCGTKVLWRSDYERIVANRSYFGDFDPFGDFDLIFGAARLGLKTVELPIRYKSRTYGTTNISRFRHGLLLFQMSMMAAVRLKFKRL